jgi:lysophospholipase L1-like esterase
MLRLLFVALLLVSASAFEGQEYVRLVGRWNSLAQANWPMSGFSSVVQAANTPSTITVEFDQCSSDSTTCCNYFVTSVLNGESLGNTNIHPGSTTLTITVPASDKDSVVSVLKITEASYAAACGVMSFRSIRSTSQLSSAALSERLKIQVFGDSLTCGYGTLGQMPCDYTPETESSFKSWASVLASSLDAELSQVTWSGKGVVRNYGDVSQASQYPLPFYYNRTLGLNPTEKGFSGGGGGEVYWDPSLYQPDLVLVLLGSNDFSTSPQPDDSAFIAGYSTFVQQIQADYKLSTVVLLCSPDQDTTHKCANVNATAINNNVHFLQIGPTNPVTWSGCSGHPSQQQQQYMAETYIVPFIKNLLHKA